MRIVPVVNETPLIEGAFAPKALVCLENKCQKSNPKARQGVWSCVVSGSDRGGEQSDLEWEWVLAVAHNHTGH